MRVFAIIGLKEGTKNDFEAIIVSADLVEVEKTLEKLQKSNGVLTERRRFTQVDFITNDHARRRISFGARRDTLEAVREADAKRHQDEQARIEKKKADDKAAADEVAKKARAKLDADNLAARDALALTLGLKKPSPAPEQNETQPPVENPPEKPGAPSKRKND